jgi:hypothetical protein
MPFRSPFGTLGGHYQSRSVVLFGTSFGTVLVAVFALVRHGSGSFGLSSVSGAFPGILNVRLILGAFIISTRGVCSLALLLVCLLIDL